ncbi:unnamed protein product [Adineta steineri]|uniref:Uncharacterized protein n=1 Tax=Adineta steineri TaxID=433720 RepID=A0A818PS72_9BILA|nr:unnamed protein product [Adineta steineri]
MFSSTNEPDIQLELHFLDCQSDSIDRSLNDQSFMNHLFRAATHKILTLENSDKRNESHRVTDIDKLALVLNHVTFIPKNMTRHVPIEISKNENLEISIPIIKSEKKSQSPPPPPPLSIEIKLENQGSIPKAPPLPASLDLAIKLQSQARKIEILSPDQETLWANVKNQNVADYFDQLIIPTNHQYSNKINESKNKTILDKRKSYNLGA